jgi:phosphohistidine phosphatase
MPIPTSSELILWRHAEAEDDVDDLARALTAKGEKQAARMAAWLNRLLPDDALILVSPARRALQTVKPLGRAFDTVEDIAPGASVKALLAATEWPRPGVTVVVGHQPTLGAVAARLLGMANPMAIKKGAIWWLVRRDRLGVEELVIRAVMEPGMVE